MHFGLSFNQEDRGWTRAIWQLHQPLREGQGSLQRKNNGWTSKKIIQKRWASALAGFQQHLHSPLAIYDVMRDLKGGGGERVFSRSNFADRGLAIQDSFSGYGFVALEFVSSKMNINDNHRLLTDTSLPYLGRPCRHNLIIQQDNTSIHTSQSTSDWFDVSRVELLSQFWLFIRP